MNIDPKSSFLQSSISKNSLGKKTETALDQSAVTTTTEQRLLDFGLNNETEKDSMRKKKKKILEKKIIVDKTHHQQKEQSKIERNPLKLLNIF